jgi:hypothetical protein
MSVNGNGQWNSSNRSRLTVKVWKFELTVNVKCENAVNGEFFAVNGVINGGNCVIFRPLTVTVSKTQTHR